MPTNRATSLAALLVAVVALSAFVPVRTSAAGEVSSPAPHVHGVASLDIVIDGDRLLLDFTAPLASLIGFEHAPRNAAERLATKNLVARLAQPHSLFLPDARAGCRPDRASWQSARLAQAAQPASGKRDAFAAQGERRAPGGHAGHAGHAAEDIHRPHAAGSGHAAHHSQGEQGEHDSLELAVAYTCSRPQRLEELAVGLFASHPALRRVDVAIAGPRGQSAARLTPANNSARW